MSPSQSGALTPYIIVKGAVRAIQFYTQAFGAVSPASLGGTPGSLHLYVSDVDTAVQRATTLGATVLRAPKDEFFGDRSGVLIDPFGHQWQLATRPETVTPEEMQRRWNAAMAEAGDSN